MEHFIQLQFWQGKSLQIRNVGEEEPPSMDETEHISWAANSKLSFSYIFIHFYTFSYIFIHFHYLYIKQLMEMNKN